MESLQNDRPYGDQYVTFSHEQESQDQYDMFSQDITLKNDDSASLNISKTKLPKFEYKKATQFPKIGALKDPKQNLTESLIESDK